jgi:hypothetical protein
MVLAIHTIKEQTGPIVGTKPDVIFSTAKILAGFING